MQRLTCAGALPLATTLILLSACSLARNQRGAAPGLAGAAAPTTIPSASAPADGAGGANPAQLQQQLTVRENEIASLKTEVNRLQEREAASRQALDTLKRMLQARAALPYSLVPVRSPEAAISDRGGNVTTKMPAGADSAATAAPGARPSAVAQEIASLRAELKAERELRQRAESELDRLRQETAAGPFESGSEHALQMTRGRIAELERELGSERRAREELTRKYEASRKRSPDAPSPEMTALRAEVETMRHAHQEALAGLERDLAASRSHERELLDALATAEKGRDGPSLEVFAGLRAENAALRSRLDAEHQENRTLSAKLKMATRVADLIFKMRAGQEQVSAP